MGIEGERVKEKKSSEVIIESKSITIDVEKNEILVPYPTGINKVKTLIAQFEKGFNGK